VALESHFSPSRSTFDLSSTGGRPKTQTQTLLTESASSTIRRVTRKSQKAVDDNEEEPTPEPQHQKSKSSGQSSPPDIRSDETSSSIPHSPRRASTPKDVTLPSPSKLPVADSMGVNDDEPGPELNEMVLDTSQTPWGRRLGIPSQACSAAASSSKPKCSEFGDGERSDVDDSHPRKKRKSDVGSIAGSGVTVRAPLDLEQDVQNIDEPRRKPSTLPSQSGLVKNTAKTKNPRQLLRSQLAGFARPGSEVQASKPLPPSSPGEDFDELDADDQLDLDEGVRDEDPIGGLEAEMEEERVDPTSFMHLRSSPSPSVNQARRPGLEAQGSTCDVVHDDFDPPDLPTASLSDDHEEDEDPTSVLSQALASSSKSPSTVSTKHKIHRPEIIRTEKDGSDISLRFDFDHLTSVWSKRKDQRIPSLASSSTEDEVVLECIPSEAGVSNTASDAKAADALALVIEKSDFGSMRVVGQFNLGFIVVRRQKSPEEDDSGRRRHVADDLFIVDQHAADEKYNFETLQATTKIASQKLFRYTPFIAFGSGVKEN